MYSCIVLLLQCKCDCIAVLMHTSIPEPTFVILANGQTRRILLLMMVILRI